jgi:hypothetical protein
VIAARKQDDGAPESQATTAAAQQMANAKP